MERVGHGPLEDLASVYEAQGLATKRVLLSVLPVDWDFTDRRTLDFGCGAGRLLRQFAEEAERSDEFWGSEIHEPSVHWAQANLCPPFKVVLNGERPPVPAPDAHFDLIYAVSVFTHITNAWQRGSWRCTGCSVRAGFCSPRTWVRGCWRLGGRVPGTRTGWGSRSPAVALRGTPAGRSRSCRRGGFASTWGRAFEILELTPSPRADGDRAPGHGLILARRRDVEVDAGRLESLAGDDPREPAALAYNVELLAGELERMRASDAGQRRAAELEDALGAIYSSRSWRLTAPLRAAAERLRARRRA